MLARRTLLTAAFAGLKPPPSPVLSESDEEFLGDQARRIAESTLLQPGQRSGKWVNGSGVAIRVPGGNMGYPAFWIRDAVMMLGGPLIPATELEGWIRLICSTIPGPGDWQVRPGVVVPAFSIADHINFDRKPTFYPGNLETGQKQGGPPWGKYPPIDDHYYFLLAVHEHWKLAGDAGLFKSAVKTSWGELPLHELCERVYSTPAEDPATGLCVSAVAGDAIDFGFCDTIHKSGKLLFPSLLKRLAALKMSELPRAIGDGQRARKWASRADRIRNAIAPTFLRSTDAHEAWLHSATGTSNQPDVWGTAYAVWSGAVGGRAADRLARSLVRAFSEATAVREGCVRHILTSDRRNGGGWEGSARIGVYQNGGYWGTPVGWYVAAMARVDPKAAAQMAAAYVRFLRAHMGTGGTTEAWEWFNPDTGANANPLYAATVVLPWLSLRQAGLLRQADRAVGVARALDVEGSGAGSVDTSAATAVSSAVSSFARTGFDR